jgi:peptidoglycan hydrolase-like protein with peptidoglycan-binding domain
VSLVVRAVGALSISVITAPLFSATAAQAAGIPAPPTKKLPSALDVAPPYEPQRICDPASKPGVVAFAELMKNYYAATSKTSYGIGRNCNSGVTEHSEGRALDWMLSVNNPTQKAIADSVTKWLSAPDAQGRPGAMARRFGIMYIIWNHKMWRVYDPARGWAPYTGSVPHTDHIHFSFSWDGAYKRTSWWTGKALTTVDLGPGTGPVVPPPVTPPVSTATGYPTLARGSRGPDVATGQKVVGTTPDGDFGPLTETAVRNWQGRNGVTVTGKLDQPTWARMVALKLVPSRTGATATRPFASARITAKHVESRRTPTSWKPANPPQRSASQRTTAQGAGTTLSAATLGTTGGGAAGAASTARTTTAYDSMMSTTLRQGSRGAAVRSLQRALGGLAVDGAYGPRTTAAVKSFQRGHQLPVTGVVDARLWRALKVRDHPLAAHYSTVLRLGSRGAAVQALQKALGVVPDGIFGPKTLAAVKSAQGRAHLTRTGVVGTVTWQAVEAALRTR